MMGGFSSTLKVVVNGPAKEKSKKIEPADVPFQQWGYVSKLVDLKKLENPMLRHCYLAIHTY